MFHIFPLLLGGLAQINAGYAERLYCPKSEDCPWTYPYYVTQNLQCIGKFQCPVGFLCCSDCHYQHQVCKAAVSGSEEPCPKDLKLCTGPQDHEKSKYFKCISDAQCYETQRCCPDSCYTHKICKSVTKRTRNLQDACPLSIRRKSCSNTNRVLKKHSCEADENCVSGYICCTDSCYDHKVCKLPNDAFAYRNVYKPSSYTTPASLEKKLRCPEVGGKCSTPYSLRLAKKFICFKDDDCKVGQLCCKDACVKEFRICKDLFTLNPEDYTTVADELKATLSTPILEKEWASRNMSNKITANVIEAPSVHLVHEPKEFQDISIRNSSLKFKENLMTPSKEKEFALDVVEDDIEGVLSNSENEQFYFPFEIVDQEGSGLGSGAGFGFQDEED